MTGTTPARDPTAPIQDDARILHNEVQTLEEMLSLIRENEQDEADFLPVLDHVRHFFLTDLMQHMHEEELVFFPAVQEKLPQGYWKMIRLRQEHQQLREAIEQFRTALVLENYVGPQTKQQHLWRLVNEARGILGLLKGHAAFEIELARDLQNVPVSTSTSAEQRTS
jgi:hemerythrin-like domain-containing protein